MAKIGIMGHGTVGSGVAKILFDSAELMANRAGEPVEVAKILDLRDFDDLPYSDRFTKDVNDIIGDDSIDVVVECMGGIGAAYQFTKMALLAGKHCITSNKELIATHGKELLSIAAKKKVNYLYEASVGGGIPIVRPLRQCLAANRVVRIAGILNGTTNYILTRMKDGGVAFDMALKEAQELGYAELDPSADVLGHDAQRKICILSHAAFGAELDTSMISCSGIDTLTREDMVYAKEMGRIIKLIAMSQRTDEGYYALVAPMLVPLGSPISVVNDVFNGVMVRGDMVGDTMFYGRGAGMLPTASAVCGDIIDAIWHKNDVKAADKYSDEAPKALDPADAPTRLFVRIKGLEHSEEEAYVLEKMEDIRIVRLSRYPDEFGFITREAPLKVLNEEVDALKGRVEVLQRIRYESL